MENGKLGETYNIGGENEWENLHLVHSLCEVVAVERGKDIEYFKKLNSFLKDRPGQDQRYAINCNKLKSELGLVGSKLPARPCDLGWKIIILSDKASVVI
jgi:dTDP-glucose 4,6-dehydratase